MAKEIRKEIEEKKVKNGMKYGEGLKPVFVTAASFIGSSGSHSKRVFSGYIINQILSTNG